MNTLDKIIAQKRKEVEAQKMIIKASTLERRAGFKHTPLSLKESLTKQGSSGIIAEFKRQSPSKGIINGVARVEEVTEGYTTAGAAGLSVLTDRTFFGGSPADLIVARNINQIPILRKDFIVDEYQIIEARAMGADVILLIAACLSFGEIQQFAKFAKSMQLEVLFEIHAQEELDKIVDDIDMVGINNRNLKDFEVDLEHSLKLASLLPDKFVKVSESGIDSIDTIKMLKQNGFQGFLIGENFMKTTNPGKTCKEFIDQLQK
jgi:indole-3-glycerol phosphate synthase